MADLHINLNGLQLKNPIMIASSPLTARLDLLEQAEENGAAAVCIKHAMMQQRFRARPRWYYNRDIGIVVSGDPRLEPEVAAELIRQAKEKTNLTVVSNLSGAPGELESWGKIAHMMEQAGADAVELNFNCPNLLAADSRLADQGSNLGSSPEGCAMVVRQVKKDCGVPVIVKLSTESGKMPQVVRACMEAGADIPNIHAGYRAAPGIDIYNGGKFLYPGSPAGSFGGHTGVYSRMATNRFVADIARQHPGAPLIGGSGLVTWDHIVETVMFGAWAVQMCTEVMHHGFPLVKRCIEGLEKFMDEQGYESLEQMRGLALQYITAPGEMQYTDVAACVDQEKCIGCGQCLKIAHCIAIERAESEKTCRVIPEKCIGCGFCVGVCPRRAIGIQQV
ncbi:MAG: 4Fe-4S binding protein [Oscillospiraceae bacterium]|nr:4Fe-4S binding protein [Oscillospiraceae bacterium]